MKIDFGNDLILKKELRKGNHKALIFLMDTYYQPICLYVYNLSNDYQLSQDIAQTIFVKIWEDRKRVESIKSLKSYLYKSAYNTMCTEWRREKKTTSIEEIHAQYLEEIIKNDDEDILLKKIKLIKMEIQQLPQKCKETFLLSKQEGLTNIEIADFMKVSLSTVENQINKAFRILREKLENKI